QQVGQGPHQIAAHGAAEAACGELDEALVAGRDEVVIEADLAELVDDDGGAREGRLTQQPAEQGGLAAAEETGQNRDGNHDGTTPCGARRRRLPACSGSSALRTALSSAVSEVTPRIFSAVATVQAMGVPSAPGPTRTERPPA